MTVNKILIGYSIVIDFLPGETRYSLKPEFPTCSGDIFIFMYLDRWMIHGGGTAKRQKKICFCKT